MDVRLSAEQRALRDAARQVVTRLGPTTVAALDDAERTAKLDAAVESTGWRELRAAADAATGDEPLASAVEVGIVAEELGRGVADGAFIGPTLAAELRRLTGAPAATAPETVALLPDLSAPALAEGSVLAGPAVAIDAAGATTALTLVPVAGGHTLVSIALPAEVHDRTVVDLTRQAHALTAGAEVTVVADQARPLTADALTTWTALGLATSAADLVGTMDGAVELARAYAADRHQYGVAVGSFQAVQHLLADAFVATEGSRSATLHALWAVDALAPDDALAAAATAKAYATRAARKACETAIQVHGGIGNTWECLAHVHLRRALVSGDLLGDVGTNLARVLAHQGIGGDA